MKLITKLDDLKGKTISSVHWLSFDEKIGLIFEDGFYAVITNSFFGESYNMELAVQVDDKTKRDIGVITEERYQSILNTNEKANTLRVESAERENLKRLKAKYED